jgi:lipoate synthase
MTHCTSKSCASVNTMNIETSDDILKEIRKNLEYTNSLIILVLIAVIMIFFMNLTLKYVIQKKK